MVRAKGLEPPCTRRRILNPVRLPVPPRSRILHYYIMCFHKWNKFFKILYSAKQVRISSIFFVLLNKAANSSRAFLGDSSPADIMPSFFMDAKLPS